MRLLFVCTGNICRSPMAERLAALIAEKRQFANLNFASAGTRALTAHPMHHHAEKFIHAMGGDASNFAARQVSARVAGDADLVLTMTEAQRDVILELAPTLMRRTFTLAEAAWLTSHVDACGIRELSEARWKIDADLIDVRDPIGQGEEVFAMVGGRIMELLPPILQFISQSISD